MSNETQASAHCSHNLEYQSVVSNLITSIVALYIYHVYLAVNEYNITLIFDLIIWAKSFS